MAKKQITIEELKKEGIKDFLDFAQAQSQNKFAGRLLSDEAVKYLL